MLMVVVAALTVVYPVQMHTGALWMIHNLGWIILALAPVDVYIWSRVYRRYRVTHPFVPVTLVPVRNEGETHEARPRPIPPA